MYALLGGVFGTIYILSMVVIGYDRYNVICKGFNGVKITPGKVKFDLIWFNDKLVKVTVHQS